MPILNPELHKKNFKIEDIHSITLEAFTVRGNGLWINPAIRITTKQEVEEKIKSDPFIQLQEYILFNKDNGRFYIRRTVDNLSTGYGVYDTLKEAKVIVEFLEKHQWSKSDLQKRNDGAMWISDCYDDKVCIMCESTQLANDGEHVICQECGMRYINDMKDDEWWL